MAIHGSVSRPLISGRLTLSAKRSHGNDQTPISGKSEGTWTKKKKWVFLKMGAKLLPNTSLGTKSWPPLGS